MRSFVATFVSSIARGLCLRDASTTIKNATVCISILVLVFNLGLAGCGGSTGGNVQPPPKTTPTIIWSTPAAIIYGATLSGTQLNATASVAGSFAYSPASGTVPNAGTQALFTTFTPTDTSSYTTATASVQIVVNPAIPIVSAWPTASAITAGAALSTSTLSGGTASVPGIFAWSAPSTVPAAGTDSENVAFMPTDAVDYTTVVGSVNVVVNPTAPQISNFTISGSQYVVADNVSNTSLPWTVTGDGFATGDNLSVAYPSNGGTGMITSYSATSISGSVWFNGLDYEPMFLTATDTNTGGQTSNQYSAEFLGSDSQSTLAISATTGTAFHVEQETSQIYTRTTSGTTGTLSGNTGGTAGTPGNIAVDDATGDVTYLFTGEKDVAVFTESGTRACDVTPNISFISSITAKGGYMVFTDPTDNKVGIVKMDCTGYQTISVAGQPWAVAMSGSDAYILSRDDGGNGVPRITKISIPSGSVEGFVDLTGVPTVTSIRATTPYEGIYQVTAFNQTPVANVLFMSDKTDGVVLTISTNTASGAKIAIAYNTPIADLPVIIAPQESGSVTKPVLWVGYLPADTGDNVMDVGALDPSTGNYTTNVGSCPVGLVGGFAASANGLQCSGGETISAPLALPYSAY